MKKLLFVILLLISTSAVSVEYIQGHVTVLEPTYLPNSISFQLDAGNVNCPSGTWLKWKKSEGNNKAVYATLMAALASGNKINFFVKDSDCAGQYIHILKD